MQIILLERIEKLGQMGDLVNVKPGFARNYLLPQGKALRANKANIERFIIIILNIYCFLKVIINFCAN